MYILFYRGYQRSTILTLLPVSSFFSSEHFLQNEKIHRSVNYCNIKCQKKHFKTHKPYCISIARNRDNGDNSSSSSEDDNDNGNTIAVRRQENSSTDDDDDDHEDERSESSENGNNTANGNINGNGVSELKPRRNSSSSSSDSESDSSIPPLKQKDESSSDESDDGSIPPLINKRHDESSSDDSSDDDSSDDDSSSASCPPLVNRDGMESSDDSSDSDSDDDDSSAHRYNDVYADAEMAKLRKQQWSKSKSTTNTNAQSKTGARTGTTNKGPTFRSASRPTTTTTKTATATATKHTAPDPPMTTVQTKGRQRKTKKAQEAATTVVETEEQKRHKRVDASSLCSALYLKLQIEADNPLVKSNINPPSLTHDSRSIKDLTSQLYNSFSDGTSPLWILLDQKYTSPLYDALIRETNNKNKKDGNDNKDNERVETVKWFQSHANQLLKVASQHRRNEDVAGILQFGIKNLSSSTLIKVFQSLPKGQGRGGQFNNNLAKTILDKCEINMEKRSDVNAIMNEVSDRVGKKRCVHRFVFDLGLDVL